MYGTIRSRKVIGAFRTTDKRIPGPMLGLEMCSRVILRTFICFFVRFHDFLPKKKRDKNIKNAYFLPVFEHMRKWKNEITAWKVVGPSWNISKSITGPMLGLYTSIYGMLRIFLIFVPDFMDFHLQKQRKTNTKQIPIFLCKTCVWYNTFPKSARSVSKHG